MARISDIISREKKPFPSIEIVPPLKGVTKEELLDNVRVFMDFAPPYINVTSHRDEFEFIPKDDGSFERKMVRNRVSVTAVCAAIAAEFPVEVVPHLICAGTSAEQTECLLNDFKFLGINNIMALRGDSLLGEKRFEPEPGGYRYASELVSAVKSFEKSSGHPFCVGVGGYPEKHFEAPNIDSDVLNLKKKVDAGADFIITQMFFDNEKFYSFEKKCRDAGIDVPIIPGIKPLSTPRQLSMLPEAFSLDIPPVLANEIAAHKEDGKACYAIGQQWCKAQCEDLLSHGVPAIHFYTMGKPDNVVGILKELF